MKKSLAEALIVTLVLVTTQLLNTEARATDGSGTSGSTGNNSTSLPTNPEIKKIKLLSLSLLIDSSATLAPQSANSSGEGYSYSGLYRFDLGVPLSRTFTATARGGYSREYSYALPDGSSGDLTDTRLGLTASLGEVRKDLKLSVGPSLTLPTSRDSQRAAMKSAVSMSAKLDQTVGHFEFILAPSYTEFYHELTVQNDGNLNISRSVNLLGEVDYTLVPSVTLGVSVQPSHGWTYQGTSHDMFYIGYDLGWEASKNLALNFGFYNRASALKSNGLEYNYQVFDQSQFMGYFDVTLIL